MTRKMGMLGSNSQLPKLRAPNDNEREERGEGRGGNLD